MICRPVKVINWHQAMAEQTRTTVSPISKNIFQKYSSKIFIQNIHPKYFSKIFIQNDCNRREKRNVCMGGEDCCCCSAVFSWSRCSTMCRVRISAGARGYVNGSPVLSCMVYQRDYAPRIPPIPAVASKS